jgi:hypothetical protein
VAVCACALAAISSAQAQPSSKALQSKLERHVKTLRHNQQVIRFFDRHGWLLTDPDVSAEAKRQLSLHRQSLRRTKLETRKVEAALARRASEERRRAKARTLASLHEASPKSAICRVFGTRHCRAAVAVAHCESRLTTTAQNGQYRGLFQMGSSERNRYGHGSSAYEQAKAAHAYFVASGRDWGPWSCKPW